MGKGINKVCLLGHVGKDPEVRSTAGGMVVASFSLATPERKKNDRGDWVDATEWHSLTCFQRTAEIVRDYVKKGSQIHVEGKLQTRSWDDKNTGEKKYRTEIIVNDLVLLGGAKGEGSSSGGGRSDNLAGRKTAGPSGTSYAQSSYAQQTPDYGSDEITDDDIPF